MPFQIEPPSSEPSPQKPPSANWLPQTISVSVPAPVAQNGTASLPGDIVAFRAKLHGISTEVGEFGKTMDGLFFGYVGVDGVVSLIPWVGDVLSGLTTFWFLSKASQVKMPVGDRLVIFSFGALDVGIGAVAPVVGDIPDLFFRAHAWNADRIQRHIDTQLAQIEMVEAQLAQPAHPSEHQARLTHLRDGLFRGGKTQKQVWARMAAIAVGLMLVLGYCAHMQQQRHELIMACETRGGWLCSWRY